MVTPMRNGLPLLRPFDNFPTHLIGNVIEDIPETDSVNPLFGDNNFCIVSLPSAIPVSYKHSLTAGSLNSCQLELMEEYHPIMVLWSNIMQYQFSSQSGMSALTQCAKDVSDNWSFESWASSAVDVV
eukprot:12530346-Ditylum_brightwellii.AAC.2